MDTINFRKQEKNKLGFTLIELLVSAALLTGAFAGIISFFSQYLRGLHGTGDYSIAMNSCQEQIERMRSLTSRLNETTKVNFSNLPQEYDNQPFTVNDQNNTPLPNFIGRTYVKTQNSSPFTIYRIKAVVCWKEGAQVIGDDTNLDGTANDGQTTNEISSPVMIETYLGNMN